MLDWVMSLVIELNVLMVVFFFLLILVLGF